MGRRSNTLSEATIVGVPVISLGNTRMLGDDYPAC
jgi:hypothetical protein